MHIEDGILRAKLDGELSETETLAAEKHLQECARCRARANEIAERAGRVATAFATLAPPGTVDAEAAWTRLQARRRAAQERPARFAWRLRPAWGLLAAAAVVVATVLISPPGSALAQRILSLFRVRSVVVVPMPNAAITEGNGRMIGQLLSDSVKVTKEEQAQPAANRQEASQLAGFTVRLPAARPDAPRLTVEGAHGLYFTASAQRLQTLLGVLGRPDLKLPEGLEGAKIVVDIPRGVRATYGNCPNRREGSTPAQWLGCVMVIQVPSPTVVTLPELDLTQVAKAGLELAGLSEADADAFARSVDWTSTLAIPLPREAATSQNVTVDGASGVLITQQTIGSRPTPWSLIWVKNGVVYAINGFGNPAAALPLAESLG